MPNPPNQQQGITFPPFAPKLKLERRSTEKPGAAPADERSRVEAENRAPEPERPAAGPETPPATSPADPTRVTAAPFQQRPGSAESSRGDGTLQTGWDQLHRARAVFEAEQESVRQVRVGLRDFDEQLKRREAAVAAREAAVTAREQAVAEREATIASATPAAESVPPPAEESVVTRLTRAPFAIARSVLGPKEKSAPDQPEA